jgi:ribosomal protein S6
MAPATAVAEYERVMRVNEDIIRYMTIKVDEFSENTGVDSDEVSVAVVEEQGE